VFQGVCGCACALVCMRYLCFPGFNSCEVCSGWVICCHRFLTCFKCLCCVCTQASGSVVSNWSLCEFWTVLWYFGIYILFLNFLRHQTMDKVQKVQFVQYQHTIVRILQKLSFRLFLIKRYVSRSICILIGVCCVKACKVFQTSEKLSPIF
jgi:hypothetical protein